MRYIHFHLVRNLSTRQLFCDFIQCYSGLKLSTVVLACPIGQFGLILWEKAFDGAYFFFVRATKEIKNVLEHKIPPKNYRECKSCLSVMEHLKTFFLLQNNFEKIKNICEIQKNYNIYSFYSIVLPLCVSKPFSLSM